MEEANGTSQEPEDAGDAEPPEIPRDARNMATLCHILGLTGFVGPLVIWLLKREDHEFVDREGKKVLNFQFTIALAYVAAGLIGCIFAGRGLSFRYVGYVSYGVHQGLGLVLVLLLVIVNTVLVSAAALKAGDGQPGKYPIVIRFLR